MKDLIKSKMLRKLMILCLLVGGIFAVVSSNNEVSAKAMLFCCEDCQVAADECSAPDHGGYPTTQECLQANGVNYCFRHCTFCG